MTLLRVHDVSKAFGGVHALRNVSLHLEAGEIHALVGENGAGKSTLISVACGLYRADGGEVRAFGRPLPPGDPRAAIDAGLGVVYQHFMLVGPLTVLFHEPQRRETEQSLATEVLANYAADDPDRLAELLLDGDAKQFVVLVHATLFSAKVQTPSPGFGLGLGTIAQPVPFHRSTNVLWDSQGGGSWLTSPTATQLVGLVHDTPDRALPPNP